MASITMYGYRKSKTKKHSLEIDPDTAPVVREILMEQKAVHTAEIEKLQLKELEERKSLESVEGQVLQEHKAEAVAFMDETELTERFIKKVYVYPDGKMKVEWNFDVELEDDFESCAS